MRTWEVRAIVFASLSVVLSVAAGFRGAPSIEACGALVMAWVGIAMAWFFLILNRPRGYDGTP